MSSTIKNALKNAVVLAVAAAISVLILAVVNAMIPEYVPTLDAATVSILNEIAPTDVPDETALAEEYFGFAMTGDALKEWNKQNGTATRKVIAAYKVVKGEATGTVIVQTETTGWASSPLKMYTAINQYGRFIKIYVVDMSETFYVASDLAAINQVIAEKSVGDLTVDTFKGAMANSGATKTSTAFLDAVKLTAGIFGEVAE